MKGLSKADTYNIIGYSFGATIAFEMCLQLQNLGEKYSLVLLDGSHSYVKMFTSMYLDELITVEMKQTEALSSFLERMLCFEDNCQQVILGIQFIVNYYVMLCSLASI